MGYSTDFYGFWTLTPALSLAQIDYLQKFSRTRRVKRNPDAIENIGVASPSENRLLQGDLIIALDPSGNRIAIDRSGLDCFVSIDIVLQEFSI